MLSNTDYVALHSRMIPNNESGRLQLQLALLYCSSIFLKLLKKMTKHISEQVITKTR
jgi:hypothetical protein